MSPVYLQVLLSGDNILMIQEKPESSPWLHILVPNVEICVRNHLITGSKMHFNLPCKSEGKVSKFYLMQHADQESRGGKRPDQLPDLEPTSLTHEQNHLSSSERMSRTMTSKLQTDNPIFQVQKSKISLNKEVKTVNCDQFLGAFEVLWHD